MRHTSHAVSPTSVPCIPTIARLQAPRAAPLSSVCPKCANFKISGKRSCCARGGSWFKNCGLPTENRFGHTWMEGVRACDDSRVNREDEDLLGREKVMLQEPMATKQSNISRARNASRHKKNAHGNANVNNNRAANEASTCCTGDNGVAIWTALYFSLLPGVTLYLMY